MPEKTDLNENGNHEGEFTLGVGGWAEYTVYMTETADTVRHDVKVPPAKVIPIIFLPGVMGSNLRMTVERSKKLKREDDQKLIDRRAWRPDDIKPLDVVAGNEMGNWFKNASPAQRQLNFDQNHTEVEYYHYTESNQRFDPEGAETVAADVRHKNVPDGLPPIPPLLGRGLHVRAEPANAARRNPPKMATPAQVARWRGWSEVLFKGPYGTMLKTVEEYMNNISKNGKIGRLWTPRAYDALPGNNVTPALTDLLLQDPKKFGATDGAAISEQDLKQIAQCWYPVHAMGYNFIKSNATSAKEIANRIRGLVKGYQKRGLRCSEVIIVTHSMGGLLARAVIHPAYGNLLNDGVVNVLGIYHNVMPTMGAASAYKRMRFGFYEPTLNLATHYPEQVLCADGPNATAVLANAPAPLEMMPGAVYGKNWLKVTDKFDRVLRSWPKENETALDNIYLKPNENWWRLINPNWINPANIRETDGGGLANVMDRLREASKFLKSIESTFHPVTFASYCASPKQASYGEIILKATDLDARSFGRKDQDPPWLDPSTWRLISEKGDGKLIVQAGPRQIMLELQKACDSGDQTVPSKRSAAHIKGTLFEHTGDGYEHQGSYANIQVLASLLYSITQIAKKADWKQS
ncbi:esterase/lipase family protein [Massilia sp. DWR3-1-1]|uniref:esterase/lipase family protein n=1 Tax=Massilia sp. DWR3-1-1 TaxID=2804559 RepID=UPI003CF43CA3